MALVWNAILRPSDLRPNLKGDSLNDAPKSFKSLPAIRRTLVLQLESAEKCDGGRDHGTVGIDAVVIDHEHGPADLMSAIGIMQAVSATDATTIMRVSSHDSVHVKRSLDAGIDGIMFPSVNTADQVRTVVATCRYPPEGKRGAAYSYMRAFNYWPERL